MSWIERILNRGITFAAHRSPIPDGLWTKCQECARILYRAELTRHLEVCPHCGHHMPWRARQRLLHFLDEKNVEEIGAELVSQDILNFRDTKKYKDRLIDAQKASNEKEALVAMQGTLFGLPVVTVAFEFSFMGGSMASVVGAKFVRSVHQALRDHAPLVCFASSGGARMQEALFSLLQMAKTSAALAKLKAERLPYISVLTHPTMGGVSASLAMLGDINIAEPKALIGFAGPRVIQQTVREVLPPGFQQSEFLLKKGVIDMIVPRKQLRAKIGSLLAKFMHQPYPLIDQQG